ncbi:GGDEF domain-containing protein [bacterium]|nr:MAG: GGDEF domain-containing protein [bacterium]
MVASVHSPALPALSSREEEQYEVWLYERQLPATLQILGFAAFAIVGFGAWDFWLSPNSIPHTWPVRFLALICVGVCAMLLRFTNAVAYWRTLSLISSCTLFSLLLLILVRLPEGQGSLLGSGGLLLSASLFRVHSPRLAIVAALFNAVVLAAVYHVFSVPPRITINSEIFLLMASLGNITLNAADDRGDRQKFALARQLQRMATTDGLTSAANRRFFSGKLTEEVERAQRYGYSLTLILLDIDKFKAVNDTRGHGDGDEALKIVAQIGIESGRASDTFARLGGEEFVLLLPHTELDSAISIAERLRARIQEQPIFGDSGQFHVTASFGVAALKRSETGDSLVARADACLYLAKNSGRNRVVGQRELQRHADAASAPTPPTPSLTTTATASHA